MRAVKHDFGFSTADAEGVELGYDGSRLRLGFIDWEGQRRELGFADVLAFRWQEEDEPGLDDDQTYELLGSEWLARQCQLQGVPVAGHSHYKLCFNACGVLDVLCGSLP